MTIINKLIPPLPPTYQVQSLEQAQQVIQLPSAEQIKQNGLSSELKKQLLNPNSRFNNDIAVLMNYFISCTSCQEVFLASERNRWVEKCGRCIINSSGFLRTPSPIQFFDDYQERELIFTKQCSAAFCYTWISRSETYCDNHQTHSCQAGSCDTTISRGEEYCSAHCNGCQVSFCFQRIPASESHCSAHQSHYCAESSCRNYIAYYQSYCSQHANACRESYCSSRIASGQSYCNQHQYSYCNSCSTTIPKGNVYCNSHLNTCLTCSTRIAGGSSYCSNCTRQNSEQTKLQELVKQRTSLWQPLAEVTRFNTYWNNNLATAITQPAGGCGYSNEDSYHWVYLLVYDQNNNEVKLFPIEQTCNKWGTSPREKHNSLPAAQREASWLRGVLQSSSNPILCVYPKCDEYVGFGELAGKDYVRIDYDASRRDFKPLDIVKVKCRKFGQEFWHIGVYLDNNQICHLTKNNNDTEIESWEEFMRDSERELIRVHPIIPFKYYKHIIEQAVWAKDNHYQKNYYELANRNCEHFANSLVLGINYSQQVKEKEERIRTLDFFHKLGLDLATLGLMGVTSLPTTINNNKEFIKLDSEFNETNGMLEKTSNSEANNLITRVKQSIPDKEECVVM